ncbi:T9SS type B sorting domain-containing protein [Flavobacterium luteum]|uniref:T9SS type B sorting domain-containing protein n=1 Tax=Flavobacterium luteum TaxID=2026654 RepID=A0A7J5AC38_9FLAO|nr:choice-of-anchor L domain-containing protein [Flavobacterium luteum]KAB1155095.1 T9SS type B sorting domain-containing protein [Flavobacterium luteum]
MKKLIQLFILVISGNCFSQAITVNTNTYTVPQLVSTVLINSPCVSVVNVTSSTGTNFGSSNGIGYFTNSNPNFPMKSGVVLSTGTVTSAVGPNKTELNDGAANWPGDSDLEKTLFQSGITMNSTNATVLEFDFTPLSPNFSFDFLFASEEYGNFQCQFSDAFAFLLTDISTGITRNLAVVPNTNQPISVITIRDYLYNSSCPSANSEYFGSFNGNSAANSSATNFNGQTKLLNASAQLIPDTLYHIKLVIADRSDSGSDSAIFIASDSFNIGQDVLGQDLTIANKSAVCFGTTQILNTNLNPQNYNFSWTKNGVVIPDATTETLSITKAGVYGVTYEKKSKSCDAITDYISVEYLPQFITKNPINLVKCDTGAATYLFDLSLNSVVIKTGLNPLTEVTYYASLSDATSATNAIPLMYSSAPNETVYVRIKNHTNACFVIKTFKLLIIPSATAKQPNDMNECASEIGLTKATFKLSKQNYSILNGQSSSIYKVSYYLSLTDANNATNIINSNQAIFEDNTTIYARVENVNDNICFSTTNFKVFVNPLPLVDKLENVIACNSYTLPTLTNGEYFTGTNGSGTKLLAGDIINETKTINIFNKLGPLGCSSATSFKITVTDAQLEVPKSGTYCGKYGLPSVTFGDYFTESGGKGTKIPFGTSITSSQTIYFYFKSITAPYCEIDINFTITIIPIQEVGQFVNVFDCNSYKLPVLKVGNYYTQPKGSGTKLEAGTVITTSQRIYVYSTTGSPNYCTSGNSFEVVIGLNLPSEIAQCGSYKLPVLPVGKYYLEPAGHGNSIPAGTMISEDKKIYVYVPTSTFPNCTDNFSFNVSIGQPKIDVLENVVACESYTLPVLTIGNYYTGSNETGVKLDAGDKITTNQTIYIFKKSTAVCSNQSSFTVTINPKPQIDSRSDIDICNIYELTPLTHGEYFTGSGGTGTKLVAGTKITSSQTIYIYVLDPITKCSDENSFNLNISLIEADAPSNISACDSYTLPALKIGNYYSKSGGPKSGEGSFMKAGDVITTTQTIYVYSESGERINCSDENIFVVTINKTPKLVAIPDVNTCISYKLPEISIGNYFTGLLGTGTMLKEDDFVTSTQTINMYAQTATTPNCYDEKSFKVTIFKVDEVSNITICENYTLPTLKAGAYYSGPAGTGLRLAIGELITSSRTIYIYGQSPFNPICYDESSFVVTIIPKPIAYSAPNGLTTVCDEDGENDGITDFDLSKLDSTVLGNQKTSEFYVKYYATLEDAAKEKNSLNTTNLPVIYARVNNSLANSCYDIRNININVIKAPIPYPKGGIVCFDSKTNTLLNSYSIPSGLDSLNYTFKWLNASGKVVGTDSTYEAKLPGEYTLITTSKKSGCSSYPIVLEISPSEPAVVAFTVSEDFSDNQTITVDAKGIGGFYEYQLNSGSFQDSPIFENVSSGLHTITVNDRNGCGNSNVQVLVINYPKYFTPNGDGVNDTWNISSLSGQSDAKIKIYDRYGKMIKVIKPSETGWDGTFSGQNMPSSDYWFTIFYEKEGVISEFKSHFAMKR